MRPPTPHRFETDGAAIYRASFAIIRTEAALARFSTAEEMVAVRMVHAAGMVELAPHIRFSAGAAEAARAALEAGAPILCDARMVSEGITRARLPAGNRIVCTLHDPEVPAIAARLGTTRSAAAVELWRPLLAGAVVAVGNAPAIVGCPVGFVGAAESKAALMDTLPAPAIVVDGRLGGSAITVAAINALASREEI